LSEGLPSKSLVAFKYFSNLITNSDFMKKRRIIKSRNKRLEHAMKVCKDIEENMKDPEYVKAVYEFIRATSR